MKIYDDLFSASDMLCEQIGRQILDTIGEDGPVVAILDGKGNWWSSDEQRFCTVAGRGELFDIFCRQIGDGCDPFVGSIDGWEVVGAQLQTESMRGAYVLIGLPGYERESTVANLPIIEMLLNQINLIASLIDKNNQLHLHQLKHLSQTAAN